MFGLQRHVFCLCQRASDPCGAVDDPLVRGFSPDLRRFRRALPRGAWLGIGVVVLGAAMVGFGSPKENRRFPRQRQALLAALASAVCFGG